MFNLIIVEQRQKHRFRNYSFLNKNELSKNYKNKKPPWEGWFLYDLFWFVLKLKEVGGFYRVAFEKENFSFPQIFLRISVSTILLGAVMGWLWIFYLHISPFFFAFLWAIIAQGTVTTAGYINAQLTPTPNNVSVPLKQRLRSYWAP
jgi:hypothetical protein